LKWSRHRRTGDLGLPARQQLTYRWCVSILYALTICSISSDTVDQAKRRIRDVLPTKKLGVEIVLPKRRLKALILVDMLLRDRRLMYIARRESI
jgi:hypothetical protein